MASDKRIILTLVCSKCKRKNYTTTKNKRNIQGKIKLMKYCPHDRVHTEHREGKA